jgi:hypothetical protein
MKGFLAAALLAAAGSAHAQTPSMPDMPGMDHSKADHAAAPAQPAQGDMAGMDMSHGMTGALGNYQMTREASGTSWQPDISEHSGVDEMRGPWMIMVHGLLNGVYDQQNGPRGD